MKSKEERKSQVVTIRMTEEEYRRLESLSNFYSQDNAQTIRELINVRYETEEKFLS
jgi:predicted DNA-binding protein